MKKNAKSTAEVNDKSLKINFQAYGVIDKKNGGIDRDATIAKCTSQLDNWTDLQAKDLDSLKTVLDSIYDSVKPGVGMKKDHVALQMVSKVGFTPESFAELTERAKHVIDTSPQYYIVLGPSGGLKRMSEEEFTHYQSTGLNPAEVAAAKKAAEKNAATTTA